MNKLGDSLFFLYLYCQVKTALQSKSSRKKIEYSYCCLGQYYATLEVTKLAILTWKQVTFTKTLMRAGIQIQYSTNSRSWMSPWKDLRNLLGWRLIPCKIFALSWWVIPLQRSRKSWIIDTSLTMTLSNLITWR